MDRVTPTDEQIEAVAKEVAYSIRHPLDQSEDAEDFWNHTGDVGQNEARRQARAAIAAVEASRVDAVGVKVKPLVWVEGGSDSFMHDADFVDTTQTYQIQDGLYWYAAEVQGVNCGSNEAAKAAAQADYERRILSALAPQPAPLILAKNQPCGCIVCTCENDDQCQGCGAKSCGSHPVGSIPNPVYASAPQPDDQAEDV